MPAVTDVFFIYAKRISGRCLKAPLCVSTCGMTSGTRRRDEPDVGVLVGRLI